MLVVYFKRCSWRFFSEKSPTITVASFFPFFRQTTDLIVYVSLFSSDFTRFTVNPAVTGSSPCFGQKLFRALAKADETEGHDFLAFEGSHLQMFLIFCSKLKCQKVQRVSPFKYFGTMRLVQILIFLFFLKVFI